MLRRHGMEDHSRHTIEVSNESLNDLKWYLSHAEEHANRTNTTYLYFSDTARITCFA